MLSLPAQAATQATFSREGAGAALQWKFRPMLGGSAVATSREDHRSLTVAREVQHRSREPVPPPSLRPHLIGRLCFASSLSNNAPECSIMIVVA
jgi:hypothetical protein